MNSRTGAVDLDTMGVEDLIQRLAAALEDPRVTQIEFVPVILSVVDINDDANSAADTGHYASSVYHPFLIGDGCLGIPLPTLPSILKSVTMGLHSLVAGTTSSSAMEISLDVVEKLFRVTLCILTLNSDHHTAWNWRKRMVRDGHIDLEGEIRLLDVFASNKRHCKSSLFWQHRRMLVNLLLSKTCFENRDLSNAGICKAIFDIWQHEIELCERACEKYPRNYHCWVYRWWCLHRVYDAAAGYGSTSTQLCIEEIELAMNWIESHPADYAACHYLHLLVDSSKKLVDPDLSDACKDAVYASHSNTESSITSLYAEYESVWNHRRWCTKTLVEYRGHAAVLEEIRFVDNIINGLGNNEDVIGLAEKHRNWLNAEFCLKKSK